MRIFILFFMMSQILLPANVLAAEHSILPWPKNAIDMKSEDFIEALEMVHGVVPRSTLMSLWGWERLEPDEGESNLKKELEGLNYAIRHYGFKPYCGLTVIDTVKRVMPDDLNGKDWNDPELILRYNLVLDDLAKELAASPPYFIIANEADVYLAENPDELEAFLSFATAAKQSIRQRFPEANIGISVTYEGIQGDGPRYEISKKLVAFSDLAFFTFYPVINTKPTPPKDTPAQLDKMIHEAHGKKVILQELGYPSGLKGSSPQTQAEFFKTIIPAIDTHSEILLTGIFALHDFDPKMCKVLTGYYGLGGLFAGTQWVKDFKSFLCTLGLRESDGRAKPAWDAVVEAVRKAPQ